MQKEGVLDKYKKIDISRFKISTKLEENTSWKSYKVESKNNSKLIYAAKIYINHNGDPQMYNRYISYVKKQVDSLSFPAFRGLSLTDFDGNNNITVFINFKDFYISLKIKERFSKYNQIDITQFTKESMMGRGSYGTVYKVVNNNDENEIYAAKTIKIDYGVDNREISKQINYIIREIDSMLKIKNPTLLEFRGISLTDFSGENNITIFTTFQQNGSLANFCFRTFDVPENYDNTAIQIILVGISYGMAILHNNMIIHRDFKPHNVLLDENLRPSIGDFGFSKSINPKNSFANSMYCGTSVYMSPELLASFYTYDKKKYNRKVDVYAFGISMYEIVTKSHAFPNVTRLIVKAVTRGERPKFDVNVKDSIQKLIQKCWAQTIDDRPSFNQIFNMLAFNIEEKNGKNGYDDYYLPDIDIDKLFDYINYIIDDNIDLAKLVKRLKRNIAENKKVIENNKNLSQNTIKLINDVIRNKEQLVANIENRKLKPAHDNDNDSPRPESPEVKNTDQHDSPKLKQKSPINQQNANAVAHNSPKIKDPINQQNKNKGAQDSPRPPINQQNKNKEAQDSPKIKNPINQQNKNKEAQNSPKPPINQQNKNKEAQNSPKPPINQQNKNKEAQNSPRPPINQQNKNKEAQDSPRPPINQQNKNKEAQNSPKPPINQQNKNKEAQDSPKIKNPINQQNKNKEAQDSPKQKPPINQQNKHQFKSPKQQTPNLLQNQQNKNSPNPKSPTNQTNKNDQNPDSPNAKRSKTPPKPESPHPNKKFQNPEFLRPKTPTPESPRAKKQNKTTNVGSPRTKTALARKPNQNNNLHQEETPNQLTKKQNQENKDKIKKQTTKIPLKQNGKSPRAKTPNNLINQQKGNTFNNEAKKLNQKTPRAQTPTKTFQQRKGQLLNDQQNQRQKTLNKKNANQESPNKDKLNNQENKDSPKTPPQRKPPKYLPKNNIKVPRAKTPDNLVPKQNLINNDNKNQVDKDLKDSENPISPPTKEQNNFKSKPNQLAKTASNNHHQEQNQLSPKEKTSNEFELKKQSPLSKTTPKPNTKIRRSKTPDNSPPKMKQKEVEPPPPQNNSRNERLAYLSEKKRQNRHPKQMMMKKSKFKL